MRTGLVTADTGQDTEQQIRLALERLVRKESELILIIVRHVITFFETPTLVVY